MWKHRNVLVTGATGLLGSHLVERLLELGAEVTAIVRDYIPASRYYTDGVGYDVREVTGDVEDADLVLRTVNEHQIQTIFHLAAQTQVRVANKHPLPTLRTNIMGTVNVLEAARLNGVEETIVASSDKAYGASIVLPYDEYTPLQGRHPYDVSKSCADLITQMYHYTYHMKVGVTRCGNLFGPGDLNFDRLIPGTILALLEGRVPVVRSDGKMIRDYFYVKDAARAYLCLAENLHRNDPRPAVFNFSYNDPMSVLEVIGMLQPLVDPTAEIVMPQILNQASNEIQTQTLDSNRALTHLGWLPSWNMATGLVETVAWYKEQYGGQA